jgi:hypothetical protein
VAFELLTSGSWTLSPTDSGPMDIQTVGGPGRPYVAFVKLGDLTPGFTIAVYWRMTAGDSSTVETFRSPDITSWVAMTGVLTPVIPAISTGALGIDIVTGTPGGLIRWDLWGL